MNDTVNNKMKRYTLVLDMLDMAIAVRNLSTAERPCANAARIAAAYFTVRKLRPAA